MIIAALRYWVQEMHVDGFRFDLGSIMTRAHSVRHTMGVRIDHPQRNNLACHEPSPIRQLPDQPSEQSFRRSSLSTSSPVLSKEQQTGCLVPQVWHLPADKAAANVNGSGSGAAASADGTEDLGAKLKTRRRTHLSPEQHTGSHRL